MCAKRDRARNREQELDLDSMVKSRKHVVSIEAPGSGGAYRGVASGRAGGCSTR